MVDAILKATGDMLLARGYEGTTTIAVAAHAGVSVGSLYQYFSNKEALIAALVEQHVAELLACVDHALASVDGRDAAAAVRALVRAGVDAHRIDPELHKILVEQVPRVGRMAVAMNTSRVITAKLAAWFAQHRRALGGRDPSVVAFVIETVVEALSHRVVIERPNFLSISALEDEATGLILAYLARPPARRETARRASEP